MRYGVRSPRSEVRSSKQRIGKAVPSDEWQAASRKAGAAKKDGPPRHQDTKTLSELKGKKCRSLAPLNQIDFANLKSQFTNRQSPIIQSPDLPIPPALVTHFHVSDIGRIRQEDESICWLQESQLANHSITRSPDSTCARDTLPRIGYRQG